MSQGVKVLLRDSVNHIIGERMGLAMNRVLVLGLGSPIISDDAVGLHIVRAVDRMGLGVDVREEPVGGMELIPMVLDYDTVVIVDAIQTKAHPPGSIYVFDMDDFEPTIASSSAHDVNLATAFEYGKKYYPGRMPIKVHLVAIEAGDLYTVQEVLTPEVEDTIPEAVDIIRELVQKSKE